MRHESYFLMKDTVENLGPIVLDLLSEPLGAYMYHAHRRELSNTEDPLWKEDHGDSGLGSRYLLVCDVCVHD